MGKRAAQIILIVLLPAILIASAAFASLNTHTHEQKTGLGGYSINAYKTPSGEEFYELTSSRHMFGRSCRGTGQKLVMDRVYAYQISDNRLYVLANQGEAVIEPNGICRLFLQENAPEVVGDDIFILPSAEAFFPRDFAVLCDMPHKKNSYSTRGRSIVESLACGRFRLENVRDAQGKQTLALVDALALESRSGNAVSLLTDVLSYSKNEDSLIVRAKNGVGVFHREGGKYALIYSDGGVYKKLNVAPDIEILASEHELPAQDRAQLEKLKSFKT